ncbi:response regulator [Planctomycetota bacterium]
MKQKIRVMLVEDHAGYREVITRALKRVPNIELTSQFGTAEIALRSLQDMSKQERPNLILLDLNLPGMSGLDALPELAQTIPDAKIIILTQSDNESDVLNAISLGASGYLLKSSTATQIREGIQAVMDGGAPIDPSVAKFLLDSLKTRSPRGKTEPVLTEREMQVLTHLAEGCVKKEIAEHLNLGYTTIDTHVRHIYEKLNVRNAPSAINKAHRIGLFSPKD